MNVRKSLYCATVTFEELLPLITEVEGMLSIRPTTYMYDKESHKLNCGKFEQKKFNVNDLSKGMKYSHSLLEFLFEFMETRILKRIT